MDSLPVDPVDQHPCVRCGACCATYRVLFPKEELETLKVPKDLSEKVDDSSRAMMGTNQPRPRCVALAGRIGVEVSCSVYENRPACCREFVPSFENGRRNPKCDQARRGKGLRPLGSKDWRWQASVEL